MNLLYLVDDTGISGRVRAVLAQADALAARGHRVTIATPGEPVHWRTSRAEWLYLSGFDDLRDVDGYDFVIGTRWSSALHAHRLAGTRAVHYCQASEAAIETIPETRERIEEVYALPIPKMVGSRHLEPLVRQSEHPVAWVGRIVDDEWYRNVTPFEHDPLRVLLCGAAQIDHKGVDDGYGAVNHARWHSHVFDFVRVSPWAPSPAEPSDQLAQEFHVALGGSEMTRLVHSCDVLIAPNRNDEGHALVVAEAMASGIPCLLTRVPAFLSLDVTHDFALFAEVDDPEDLGERLMELLEDEDLREHLRKRGRQVAGQFRAARVAARVEEFLEDLRNERADGTSAT